MNYAVVVLATILGGATLYWIISAGHWFKGPISNIFEHSEAGEDAYEQEKPAKGSDTASVVVKEVR